MSYCRIIGVGGYTPKRIHNDEYIEFFGKRAQHASHFLSHENRYQTIDLETGESEISNLQMGYEASIDCLKSANVSPFEVDLIIYTTLTPNNIIPASYTMLQEKLGISSCAGFDIQSGCAGFGTALVTACTFIESGLYNTALVVGADNLSSRFGPFMKDKSLISTRMLLNMMMFGDGAGAMLLQSSNHQKNSIYYKMMRSNRPNESYGSIIEVGGSKEPYGSDKIPKENWPVYQNSGISERILPEILSETLNEFLKLKNKNANDIGHYILPVLNKKMLPAFDHLMPDFPVEKAISIEGLGGAMINSAVPLSFYYGIQTGKIKSGDECVFFAGENTKWQHAVIAGFWSPNIN